MIVREINQLAQFILKPNPILPCPPDGFRKITHIENSGLKVENDEIEFYHQCFLKGQENLLEYIKRKVGLLIRSKFN